MLNIVVPMAGRGSRFQKAGYTIPKPLIPVFEGVPMIKLVIDNMRPTSSHRFIFVCQREHDTVYDLNRKLKEWAPGCEVVFIDGITEGAACTVLKARDLIDSNSPLMIVNSDQYIDFDVDDYLCASEHVDGLIMTMIACDPKWSYVALDEKELVKRVAEKQVISHQATVGVYNFKSGKDFVSCADMMISLDDKSNGEFYVAPVYNYLISEGKRVGTYNIGMEGQGMFGLGIPEDLAFFQNHPEIQKKLCQNGLLRGVI